MMHLQIVSVQTTVSQVILEANHKRTQTVYQMFNTTWIMLIVSKQPYMVFSFKGIKQKNLVSGFLTDIKLNWKHLYHRQCD